MTAPDRPRRPALRPGLRDRGRRSCIVTQATDVDVEPAWARRPSGLIAARRVALVATVARARTDRPRARDPAPARAVSVRGAQPRVTTSSSGTSSRVPVARSLRSTTPRRDALGADDELHRHADEVGVGELHARAHVAVVVEHVDALRAAAPRRCARRPRCTAAALLAAAGHDDEVHVVGRERRAATRCRARRGAPRRPRRARATRRCRSNPSPSGAARRSRRCSARRAPREYFVPSWNTWPTSMPRSIDERLPAARARVAGHDRHDVGPHVDVEVATEHRVAHVVVELVRAGDPRRSGAATAGRRRRRSRRRSAGRCSPSGARGARRSRRRRRGAPSSARAPAASANSLTSRSPGTMREPELAVDVERDRTSTASTARRRGASATPAMPGRSGVCTFSQRRRGRRRARPPGSGGDCRARGLDVGGVVAARAPDEVVLADRGDGHELVVHVAAHLARLRLDRPEREPAALEHAVVRVVHRAGSSRAGRRGRGRTSTRPSSGTRGRAAARSGAGARRGTSS